MGVVVWGEVVVGELLAGVVGGEVVEGMVVVVEVVVGFLAFFVFTTFHIAPRWVVCIGAWFVGGWR